MDVAGVPMRRAALPPPSRAWWTVMVFCVAAVLSYTDRQILSLLVDPMRADLRLTDTQFSLLQGLAFAIVYAFAGLPFGRLADVVPRRRVIIAGVLIWSAATVLCGLARSFEGVFAARMAVGVGEAALAPAAVAVIADSFPPSRRGTATGVFLMGMVVGAGAALAIGGYLLESARAGAFAGLPVLGALAPWRAVLVSLGAAGLLVAGLLFTITDPWLADAESGVERISLRDAVGHFVKLRHSLVPLYLAMTFVTIGDFSLLSWGPAYLSRNFGLDSAHIGYALGGISIVTGIVGALGGGLVSDWLARGGPSLRLKASVFASAAGIAGGAIAFSSDESAMMVLFGLWFLTSSLSQVIGIIVVQEIAPPQVRGLAMALVSFTNMMFGLVGGATLTAAITDYVYADPHSVGFAITNVVVPAGIIATLLYLKAARAAPTRNLPATAAAR